jgi:hypothetical protein
LKYFYSVSFFINGWVCLSVKSRLLLIQIRQTKSVNVIGYSSCIILTPFFLIRTALCISSKFFLERWVQVNLFFLPLCLLMGTSISITYTSFHVYYTLVYFRPKLKSNSLIWDPILLALLSIIILNKIADKLYIEFYSVPFFKLIQRLK